MAIWRNAWSTSNYQYTNFKKLPQQSIWDFSNVPLTSPGIIPRIHSTPFDSDFETYVSSPHVIFCSIFLFKSWNLYHFFIYLAKLTNSPFECGGSAHEPVKKSKIDFFINPWNFTPMSGRFWESIVVLISPLKRFGDHFRPRDKICEKPIFLLQNPPY